MDTETLFKHIITTYKTELKFNHPTLQLHLQILNKFGPTGNIALQRYLVNGNGDFYSWHTILQHLREILLENQPSPEDVWNAVRYCILTNSFWYRNAPVAATKTVESFGGIEELKSQVNIREKFMKHYETNLTKYVEQTIYEKSRI